MKSKILLILLLITSILTIYGQNKMISFSEIEKEFQKDEVLMQLLDDGIKFTKQTIPKNRNRSTGYEMVIITNSTLQSYFEDFAVIKTAEGVRTFVHTFTNPDSSTVRNYLSSLISGTNPTYPDLKYVLIGGDETIIPTVTIPWIYGNTDKSFSTDFYYSNVLHDFPTISVSEDMHDIELEEDLIVGRIPAQLTADAIKFVLKYQKYRTESYENALYWKFSASNLSRAMGSMVSSFFCQRIIDSLDVVNAELISEADLVNSTAFDSTANNILQGSMEKYIDELNDKKFSFLYSINHGSKYNIEVGDSCVVKPDSLYRRDGHATCLTINEDWAANGIHTQYHNHSAATYFMIDDFVSSNSNYPFVHFLASCETTNLVGGIEIPIGQEYFNSNGGPVLLEASTCLDYPAFTYRLKSAMLEYMFDNSIQEVGELRKLAWEEISDYFVSTNIRMLYLSDQIFGDPSMKMWSGYNGELVIKKRGDYFTVVDESGNEVEDALIAITDSNGIYISEGLSPLNYPHRLISTDLIVANCNNYLQTIKTFGELSSDATLPYTMNFENGIDKNWDMETDSESGRIQVSSENSPYSGTKHLTFDSSTNGVYATNEGWLYLDLEGKNRIFAEFYWKEFGDETNTEDGVYLSDDSGVSFSKVMDLTGSINNTWIKKELNIDSLATVHNLDLNNSFIIKFQQKDNYGITSDGFAFDDISIYTKYATSNYSTGFENGLDEYWEIGSSNQYGRVIVTDQNLPYEGSYHLTMDVTTNGNYAENYAQFFADLTSDTYSNFLLEFQLKDFGDENHTQDGVYFSDNGGVNFTKVFDILGQSYTNNIWNSISLNIDDLCSSNGLTRILLILQQQFHTIFQKTQM